MAAEAATTTKRDVPADSAGMSPPSKMQRRAAFRKSNLDAARAAKEARRRAVLVLFSGPADRPDGFEARCAEENVRCVMIDTCHGGVYHDLLRDQVYENLLQRCQDGEFATGIIAVPCNTFSVARMRPGGPVVMRTLADSESSAKKTRNERTAPSPIRMEIDPQAQVAEERAQKMETIQRINDHNQEICIGDISGAHHTLPLKC